MTSVMIAVTEEQCILYTLLARVYGDLCNDHCNHRRFIIVDVTKPEILIFSSNKES